MSDYSGTDTLLDPTRAGGSSRSYGKHNSERKPFPADLHNSGGGGAVGVQVGTSTNGVGAGVETAVEESALDDSEDYLNRNHPFFVKITHGSVLDALHTLDASLKAAGKPSIIASRQPISWTGHEVNPGQLGIVNHGGLPELLIKPGKYPRFPWRLWWARSYKGVVDITSTVFSRFGLTIVQVSQNQAAVVLDPNNRVFVVRNGGFVAMAFEGSYRVLEVVDQTHLPHIVRDPATQAILGWTQDVTMPSASGKGGNYVVAQFINLPAQNCAILQTGDTISLLRAGQWCITKPNVTLRGLWTFSENQLEMPTKDIFTRDQVPVSLVIYLKWQLREPLKLAIHGYDSPYAALRDKAQSILTQIVSHLDYSSMIRQRGIGGEGVQTNGQGQPGDPGQAAFLDALQTAAMDDLHAAAVEYGIELKDLAVIDRKFKGETAATMDTLVKRAMQAQVEAANVDRENSNRVKQAEGTREVQQVEAEARKIQADAQAYTVIAAARAAAQATTIAAEAEAAATRLRAKASADAIATAALADQGVEDQFAREVLRRRIDVEEKKAYNAKSVVFVGGQGGGDMDSATRIGLAAGLGGRLSKDAA